MTSSYASGTDCQVLLGHGEHQVISRQASVLVGEAVDALSMRELYLKLKEQETSLPEDISLLRVRLLSSDRARLYDFERLSDQELLQYRRNAMQALYARVASLWRAQEVRGLAGEWSANHQVMEVLVRLFKKSFLPWGLEDSDLSLEKARAYFAERPWREWPWAEMATLLADFMRHHPGEFSSQDFSRFWDKRAGELGLPFEFYSRLERVLRERSEPSVCCLSEPGCVTCPHNRRWLLKKPSL